jgi:hypothetical protein
MRGDIDEDSVVFKRVVSAPFLTDGERNAEIGERLLTESIEIRQEALLQDVAEISAQWGEVQR